MDVEAVGGGYCRLEMPLRLALAVRGTVAGHRLGAPSNASLGHAPGHSRSLQKPVPHWTTSQQGAVDPFTDGGWHGTDGRSQFIGSGWRLRGEWGGGGVLRVPGDAEGAQQGCIGRGWGVPPPPPPPATVSLMPRASFNGISNRQ